MDTSNWRPTQGAGGGDSSMEIGDWRSQLQADSRQRIVNKIMDTLKRHLPFSGLEGLQLQELKKIAVKFEEKTYTAATGQSDYLRKISFKMLTMENRSQNSMPDAMQSNSGASIINPSDPGSQVLPQVNKQGQQLSIPVPSNHTQSGQQMMSQNMHNNNISSAGIQGSSSISSALPPGSGLSQSSVANSNLQNIQNMPGFQQGTAGNTLGSNNFSNQRQMQQQSQNSQYLYQQQQLHQLANQKLQQSNMTPPMQSHIQQQQNLLQPTGHLQSSQQSTLMQTSSLSTVQNQQPVVPQSSQPLMNHQQSVLRQQRQQQVQTTQPQLQTQPNLTRQQQANTTNMQQSPVIGQQNSYSDMQQQQQPYMIGQQNNLSSMQQQHLVSQSNASAQQPIQHSVQHMSQSKMQIQQQNQQNSATLLATQVQQSQPQLQQVGMQQQTNMLQRDMQQRLPTSGGFQQQNMLDQQKQLFQQQRPMPEASSTSLDSTAQTVNPNGGDWQEEVYQKIQAMKDLYLLDLNDMHQKIVAKLQQNDSLPQQLKNEQIEKLKVFKNMLERFMQFLQIPKHSILANYKDKLSTYEKQIVNVINSNRWKPAPTQQQPLQMHSGQQSHSQLTQVQSHDNQVNIMQGSMAAIQPIIGSLPQSSGGSNAIQTSSNLDPGQNNSMNPLQQVSGGSLQQNSVSGSGSQQVNIINPMSLEPNSNMLQNQHHIKQQEQLIQNQQLKQFQQRQMQQQFLQKQQLMQHRQQQQQTKQQANAQLQQQMGVKAGGFQQHQAASAGGQRSVYHQQMKLGSLLSAQVVSAANIGHQQQQQQSPSSSSSSGAVLLTTQSLAIGTPGISASPLLEDTPDGNHGVVPLVATARSSSVTEQPLERLLKVVKSISPEALSASVGDIGSVVSMIDRIAGSAPGNGSRAAVGEDLVAMTKCRLQARNFVTQDGTNGMKNNKMKRFTSAMPLNVVSSTGSVNDNFNYLNVPDTPDLDSTASSPIKKPRIQTNHALLEEIKEINRGLIDTVVSISEEDGDPGLEGGDGTVVKCSFTAVALGPNLKSHYNSAQMSPIQPLRLLVPANYPNCSPILLDKFPAQVSKKFEDLSVKTKSRFSSCLRSVSQPMSLKEIAKIWDVCSRAVISEYAQKTGGGTFSSKYGTWENCLSAA